MKLKFICYSSDFPKWSSKDKCILSYLSKRYNSVVISLSNLWELNIWNRKLLKNYNFILSKDKCPVIFLDKDNFSTIFSEKIENYLSGSIALMFFSEINLEFVADFLQNISIKDYQIEKLAFQLPQLSFLVEKVFDDIDGHKTIIYYAD